MQAFSGLCTISGPSGVGKTTLIKGLLDRYPFAKSLFRVTTRGPRPDDNPAEYEYVSEEAYFLRERAGEFATSMKHHGWYHGATKHSIDAVYTEGSLVFADLSPMAVRKLQKYIKQKVMPDTMRSLYLDLASDELRRRLMERKETEAKIAQRLQNCRRWKYVAWRSNDPLFFTVDAKQSKEEMLADAMYYFFDGW